MSKYITQHTLTPVPQSEPTPGRESEQALNRAGGYVFKMDPLKQLERWLILGSEGGTYYAGERELTLENVQCLEHCVNTAELGLKTVALIHDVGVSGRAPKVSTTIYALAVAAASKLPATRAMALDTLPHVCRTGSHLLEFARYVDKLRGWGPALRKAVAGWYRYPNQKPSTADSAAPWVAYQTLKYRQRDGWSHRDLLRLSHPKADSENLDAVYEWIVAGNEPVKGQIPDIPIIEGYHKALLADSGAEIAALVTEYGLTHEMIPSEYKNDPAVQEALLAHMPLTAMIRNLGNYTKSGLIAPLSNAAKKICDELANVERLRKSRVHPIQVLMALRTYQSGRGFKGSGEWSPVNAVCDALEAAFYAAFGNVEPTGKNFYLGVDVSGSMAIGQVAGVPNFSPREAAMALAMVTMRTEKNYHVAGFQADRSGQYVTYDTPVEMIPINITARDSLKSACEAVERLPFGATDCAQPMLDALKQKMIVDCFVILTDNETWAGSVHPHKALESYRKQINPNAALVVVGMVSTGYSIADPADPKQLDVVGFDTAVPGLIREMALSGATS